MSTQQNGHPVIVIPCAASGDPCGLHNHPVYTAPGRAITERGAQHLARQAGFVGVRAQDGAFTDDHEGVTCWHVWANCPEDV